MTRLIDADALLPMMKYATTDSEIGIFPIKIGFSEIVRVIDDAPTVDAQPVRHGQWDYVTVVDEGFWRCSNCGTPSEALGAKKLYKYCPFCGAKMDEQEAQNDS